MPYAREQKNLDDLAKVTTLQQFGAGEKVIRQGDRSNHSSAKQSGKYGSTDRKCNKSAKWLTYFYVFWSIIF
jgi:hypothetical protein